MANKEFLETYPLYKKFKTSWTFYPQHSHTHIEMGNIPKPAIHMHCSVCKSEQTFNMSNEYSNNRFSHADPIHGEVIDIRYTCSSCKKGYYVFLVYFGFEAKKADQETEIYLQKVGQIPAWSIAMNKDLEGILGENAKYYKNALICESHGYGIGAHAYYRRIVEDVIGELLESIAEHISSKDELAHYNEAMESVRKTRVAQEKIELVKDLLPASLRPNGINPLQVMYDELSEGIHYNSDEECLESADAIRVSIAYLASQVMKKKMDHHVFSGSIQKILDKKAKKNADKNATLTDEAEAQNVI